MCQIKECDCSLCFNEAIVAKRILMIMIIIMILIIIIMIIMIIIIIIIIIIIFNFNRCFSGHNLVFSHSIIVS